MNILFSDRDERWNEWEPHLRAAFTRLDIDAELHRSHDAPEAIDYIIYSPASSLRDFTPYQRLKAVLSMWAGVEKVVGNTTITCPLTRMVDQGLTTGMVEYVLGHTMRYHLGIDRHISNRTEWLTDAMPPLARSRTVGILGLGELGQACASGLRQAGFAVHGWSRNPKQIEGITSHNGSDGLANCLNVSEILVLLLPDTPATTDLINARTLHQLPEGAFIINPGRGPLIVDKDLIAALDEGHIAGATLDVFRTEPLAEDHPFWKHPKITITPHIAAETRPETASDVIAENISRCERGEPLLHLVDRLAGY